eukprot:Rhum_TRINITY_DN9215_c0_g1::Rhum_TRINITY_DN9215_c0_g1_i1::g.32299::m.32299
MAALKCPLAYAHLWLHFVCSAYVLVALFVGNEAVFKDEYFKVSWPFVVSPLLAIVVCALGCFAAVPCLGRVINPVVLYRQVRKRARGEAPREETPKDAATDTYLGWFAAYYLSLTCALILAIFFLPPFNNFSTIVATEKGLAGSQAPGWASINCMTDAQPKSIDVRTDLYSYFVLADPEWRVAAANTSLALRKDGWSWIVAPILYHGPVAGCRTKEPLFAVCVAKTKGLSTSTCWWDNNRRGPWTGLRLMTASGDFPPADQNVFWGKVVRHPYHPKRGVKLSPQNVVQFNTATHAEAAELVKEKNREFFTMTCLAAAGWFAATLPVALCACAVALCRACLATAPADNRRFEECDDVEATATQLSETEEEVEEMEDVPVKDEDLPRHSGDPPQPRRMTAQTWGMGTVGEDGMYNVAF